jgi:hypothetical protein
MPFCKHNQPLCGSIVTLLSYSVALYAASFIYAFLCKVDFLFELGYSQKMTMKYIKPDGMEFSLSKYMAIIFTKKKVRPLLH